ncbi:DnaJ domain-containing protein [Pelagibius sp. Alg239-R121]|uniref:DnaJ domain-containing protein n=1 Tax=Pelagibius sp. Alg239-R121 TaxID=2993448 RepID=UPI0024A702B1|nr:DnaJ domain-containing protein [Pelagibius sp. Alg239-R121]
MIGYFFLGLCSLVGLLLLAKWYSSADPKALAKTVPRVVIVVAVAILILIVLTGRIALLLALAPVILMFFARFRALKNRVRAAMGPQPGQTSEVVTRYFRMTLDHDSGDLSGDVLDGAFAGRGLDELTREELMDLWNEIVVDAQSASVLESYLNRRLGPDWPGDSAEESSGYDDSAQKESGHRRKSRSGWGSSSGRRTNEDTPSEAMTRQQAYEVLGLKPGASKEEVREAHKRLLQKIHPDHGGSNFLAAQINRAKDLLLKD